MPTAGDTCEIAGSARIDACMIRVGWCTRIIRFWVQEACRQPGRARSAVRRGRQVIVTGDVRRLWSACLTGVGLP